MGEEFKFPDQITPMGTSPKNKNIPERSPSNISKRKIPFRVGEVIRGTIQQVYSPSEILIDLPNGSFLAEVNGKFEVGDSLFFQVQRTEPSLFLRIHSVFSKGENSSLPVSEILRLLNFPSNKIFTAITENLKETHSLIIRDDVIYLAKNIDILLANEPKEELGSLINFLLYIDEFNLIPTINLFRVFKSFLLFPLNVELLVKYIVDSPQIIPNDLQPKVYNLFQNLQTSTSIARLLTMYSVNYFRIPNNLFELIFQLFNRKEETKFPPLFNTLLNDVINGYESFIVFSSLSTHFHSQEFFVLTPFILSNSLKYLYVVFHRESSKSKFQRKKKIKFEEEKFFPLIPDEISSQLDNFFSEDKNQNFLMKYEQNLRKNLKFIGSKIVISSPSGEKLSFETKLLAPPEESQKISIVI